MQNNKVSANLVQDGAFEGAEMRRRIAGCRERLRRNRAAQRIAERIAEPAAETSGAEEGEQVERHRGRDRV